MSAANASLVEAGSAARAARAADRRPRTATGWARTAPARSRRAAIRSAGRDHQPIAERADPLDHPGHVAIRILAIGQRRLVAEAERAEEHQPAPAGIVVEAAGRALRPGLLDEGEQVILRLDIAEERLVSGVCGTARALARRASASGTDRDPAAVPAAAARRRDRATDPRRGGSAVAPLPDFARSPRSRPVQILDPLPITDAGDIVPRRLRFGADLDHRQRLRHLVDRCASTDDKQHWQQQMPESPHHIPSARWPFARAHHRPEPWQEQD